MTLELLKYEVLDGGVAVVTVNRPDKLNALNAQVMRELGEVVSEIERDSAVRGVIVTGSGEKAFVAGADIRELSQLTPVTGRDFAAAGQAVFGRLEALTKPVVAAVNGYALGGGCELALACHMRVASETARLGLPEVSLGILPGFGGTQRLVRLVGRGRALELILTGDPVDAAEAHRIGLVNRVVPAAELMAAAESLIRKILTRGPLAVGLAIRATLQADDGALSTGLAREADLFGLVCATQDFREGTAAFLEKRKPAFQGA